MSSPGTGWASGCRPRSAYVARWPGMRPSAAMYGRLARYRTNAIERRTAISMPVRTVVSSTPTMAAIASMKSVRRHAQ